MSAQAPDEGAPEPRPTTSNHATHNNRIAWGWWAIAAAFGVVALAIVAIALIGMWRSGKEIDPNTMFGALLTFLAAIAALIIPKLNAVGKNTSETAQHVVNSHGSRNMRDDLDEIKRYVKSTDARVGQLERTQGYQSQDILGIREEIGQIRKDGREQWAAIEDTAGKVRQNIPDGH